MKKFITLNEEKIIVAIRYAKKIVNGEIESVDGEIGQRLKEDGTFEDVVEEPVVA